jgi:excinuclease ABC subunit C
VTIPTPLVFNPRAADFPERIAASPGGSAVYALRVAEKRVHIAWSANVSRRLHRLFVSYHNPKPGALAALRSSVESIECWPAGSRLETWLLLYYLIKAQYPDDYLKRLRLRMPWFLMLTRDPFPRLATVNRIPRASGPIMGPFLSRDAAQRYESEVLGLFQIRRCTDTLAPHPEHPGCIYGEMNQCLRPCQCAVSTEEYASEAQRTAEFLETNGKAVLANLFTARDRASESMEFEHAAQIHKRIEKIRAVAALRDDVVTDVRDFNGVALVPTRDPKQFRLWPIFEGQWRDSLLIDFLVEQPLAKSLDQRLRELLAESLAQPHPRGNRLEELAIFSKWYFSSWRDGEWFAFRTLADLDYRRLVRELSKRVKSGAPVGA